jgi:glutamate/tyrosine decarboxylase-like PLP-dependent enzyme
MSMREHGIERFAATIEANVRQAQHLADLIRSAAELELMAPAPLNVVCFRYRGDDAVNERILVALQERGLAVPSSTRLNGRFAIRAAITNHRTMMADMDFLVDAVLSIGREITAGQAGACAV